MRKLLLLGLVMAIAAPASATVIIKDDFESYADDTALSAVWPLGVGTVADSYLVADNGPTWPGVQAVEHTTGAARRDQSFAPFAVAGDHITWAFDFYDPIGVPPGDSSRQYGQLLSAVNSDGTGGLSELIAMGTYNSATNQDSTKYQARAAFSSAGWFNLNTDRAIGWHRFVARIHPTYMDIYVDGVLDTANVPQNGGYWYQARIGSGLSSAGGSARFDNYVLTPEPASLALLALGGLVMLRRRR